MYAKGFRSSDLYVFSTPRGCFLAAAAATPNKHMVAISLYNQKLSFFILFYNSKNRHLKFLNLSPQGLISSTYYGWVPVASGDARDENVSLLTFETSSTSESKYVSEQSVFGSIIFNFLWLPWTELMGHLILTAGS